MFEQLVVDLNSADPGVRFYAAQRLGALGDERAVEPLIAALPDENSKVQYGALSSLIKLGADRAIQPILDVLLDNPNSRVWELLKMSVGMRLRTGMIAMVRPDDRTLSDRLIGALAIDALDEHQRGLMVRMVGRTGDLRHFDALVDLLQADRSLVSPVVKVAAAEALGHLRDSRAVHPLIDALSDNDDAIRETAAEALGRIGDSMAFDAVLVTLNDESEWVRRASAEALGAFGDARAVDALTNALSDESAMVQDAAFESLKRLSSDHFTALL
ncbi:MAG: HEAT repeat domain-containing protein [Chloroflexi bacterium]|nr:HEAT repeat domain-containing protein [Chloroflexota bacterium]